MPQVSPSSWIQESIKFSIIFLIFLTTMSFVHSLTSNKKNYKYVIFFFTI